jgi:hypothetical protein
MGFDLSIVDMHGRLVAVRARRSDHFAVGIDSFDDTMARMSKWSQRR